LPTCPQQQQQQQKTNSFEPRFKIDHAASSMPKTSQPERSLTRPGEIKIGTVGEIISVSRARSKSVHPGEIIGIRNTTQDSVRGCWLSFTAAAISGG
jgi:hypothetical protein